MCVSSIMISCSRRNNIMRNTQQHATTTVGTSYLRVADDANDLAVFLNTIEVLVQLLEMKELYAWL